MKKIPFQHSSQDLEGARRDTHPEVQKNIKNTNTVTQY